MVGAGPGDPGLLTARALELIAAADVVVYDRLIPEAALSGARSDANLIYVGKEGGGPSVPRSRHGAIIRNSDDSGDLVYRQEDSAILKKRGQDL